MGESQPREHEPPRCAVGKRQGRELHTMLFVVGSRLAADANQPERLFRPNPKNEKMYRNLMGRFETLARQTGKADGGEQ